jgi:CRP-like cAMP-binding protein
MAGSSTLLIENRLLANLPQRRYQQLFSKLQPVKLSLEQVLYEAGAPMKYVLFPTTAMVSLVAFREDKKRSVEVGIVGSDGLLGVSALLGNGIAIYHTVVQLPGSAFSVRADVVRAALEQDGPLKGLFQSYMQALLLQLSRSVVCNCFHKLEERLARWLLMTHDYARADTFPMKQAFMTSMLAARRISVTQAAYRLQKEGVISYRRGQLTVHNRKKLEAAACNCYRIVRNQLELIRTP